MAEHIGFRKEDYQNSLALSVISLPGSLLAILDPRYECEEVILLTYSR